MLHEVPSRWRQCCICLRGSSEVATESEAVVFCGFIKFASILVGCTLYAEDQHLGIAFCLCASSLREIRRFRLPFI